MAGGISLAQQSGLENYNNEIKNNYLESIGLSEDYSFENGAKIKPLPPVEVARQGVFIIGAYPSAVFKREGTRTVPVDNLEKPFDDTVYVDDSGKTSKNKSGMELDEKYLSPLGISRSQCWITNLVKVFLYKQGHSNGEAKIGGGERDNYDDYAVKSLPWLYREIEMANPTIIITLGREVASAIRGVKGDSKRNELLNYEIGTIKINGKEYSIVHMVHPGLLMRTTNENTPSKLQGWSEKHKNGLIVLKPKIQQLLGGAWII